MKYNLKIDKSTINESFSVGDDVIVYSIKKEGSDEEEYNITKLVQIKNSPSLTIYGLYKIKRIIDLNKKYFRITIAKKKQEEK